MGSPSRNRVIYDAAMQAHYNAIQSNNRVAQAGTLSSLDQTLSADGQAKLKKFIQGEKRNMQYHTQKPILQKGATQ